MLDAAGDGRLKALYAIGYDVLLTNPEHARTRAALAKLEDEAKALGFASYADMKTAAKRAKDAAAKPAPRQAQQPNTQQRQQRPAAAAAPSHDPVREKRLAARVSFQVKRSRKLQRQLDAKDAEMELREVALRHGVRDVAYALHLLKQELSGKDDATIASFDENTFFGERLKQTHPFLYQAVQEPATTSPAGSSSAAPAPKPGPAKKAEAEAGQVDARQLSRDDYHKLLKEKGLVPPDQGLSF